MARTKKTTTEANEVMETSTKKFNPNEEWYGVKMWFIQPLLGSLPGSEKLRTEWIASKAPDAATMEDELLQTSVEHLIDRGTNVFARRSKTGNPTLMAYTIRGYYKEAVTAFKRSLGNGSSFCTNHKTKIAGNVVLRPNYIDLQLPEEVTGEMTEEEFKENGFGHYEVIKFPKEGRFQGVRLRANERPLQAETAQGKITAIAASEQAPAGTSIEYKVCFELAPKEMKEFRDGIFQIILRGERHGTGQWRGSGLVGCFVAEIRDESGNIVAENTSEVIGVTSDDPAFKQRLWEYIDDNSL